MTDWSMVDALDPVRLRERLEHHLDEMEAWATGSKSWTNVIDDKATCAVGSAADDHERHTDGIS